MAELARLRVYPVKALDGIDVDRARITDGGTLEYDREYALFADDGDPINGVRTDAVHRLTAAFDPDDRELTLTRDGDERTFSLPDERDSLERWCGTYFGEDVTLRRDRSGGFVDRQRGGPSVVSTATLREVASWFDGMTVKSVRRRIRANVEVDGVPAFWEDRFVGETADGFSIGDVRFEGVEPCVRCIVPERDPDTGAHDPTFRQRLVERRRETYPEWVDRDAFRSDYSLMLIADVPPEHRGEALTVGDSVSW